jgi:hypothetical protein
MFSGVKFVCSGDPDGPQLVTDLGAETYWRETERPPKHDAGDAAVMDGGTVCRQCEILCVSARVISDAGEPRVLKNGSACHNGIVAPIGVMLAAFETLHIRFSLSATTLEGARMRYREDRNRRAGFHDATSLIPSGVWCSLLHG